MNRLKTREVVAEILEASGLFIREWVLQCSYMYCSLRPTQGFPNRHCMECLQLEKVPKFEFPTANQSEEILDQLEVQVVWSEGSWECGQIKCYPDDTLRWRFYFVLPNEIPRQDRELANAATVAWFALKEPEKLKEAVAALEQQK